MSTATSPYLNRPTLSEQERKIADGLVPTPWGAADHIERVGDGIIFVSTPSHGGFRLDAARNAKVPLAWRLISFNRRGMEGWYEEDCDWCLVVKTFPDLFPESARIEADKTFGFWHAKKLAKIDAA